MNGSRILVQSAVHNLSASIFLFSLGVAKTFGLQGGGGVLNLIICNFDYILPWVPEVHVWLAACRAEL